MNLEAEMGIHGLYGTNGRIFRFATLLIFTAIISGCAASAEATNAPDSSETQTAQEPTELPALPAGKLLEPCGLIPPEEAEAVLGDPVSYDSHRSYWQPGETTQTFYECQLSDDDGDGIAISVEVFVDLAEAAAQLEDGLDYNNRRLEEYGLEPLAEVSGIGERAYRHTEAAEYTPVPDIYFLSGNYVITITISPPATTVDAIGANFETALEFAHNALIVLADPNLRLNSPSQPAGKPLEPCALITSQDAQAFINTPIVSEQSTSFWNLQGPSNYDCVYTDDFFEEWVEIVIEEYADMDLFMSQIADSGIVEVSGIGERAFRYNPYNFSDVSVFSGNYLINIDVFNSSSEETQFENAVELAELALGRLP